jgi:hypothetical protein
MRNPDIQNKLFDSSSFYFIDLLTDSARSETKKSSKLNETTQQEMKYCTEQDEFYLNMIDRQRRKESKTEKPRCSKLKDPCYIKHNETDVRRVRHDLSIYS